MISYYAYIFLISTSRQYLNQLNVETEEEEFEKEGESQIKGFILQSVFIKRYKQIINIQIQIKC